MHVMTSSDPVSKALWFIETHLRQSIDLESIEEASGVSRYHLSRVFASATGYPVMRYVRGRRLSEAAAEIHAGATDLLSVALDAGYGSHEAFTRAFREQFGITPDALRARGALDDIPLVEALRKEKPVLVTLEPPRIQRRGPFLVAGLPGSDRERIPFQWQQFGPYIGAVPGQVGHDTYGVCICGAADAFEYVAAVEVSECGAVPPELRCFRIEAQTYAVFVHRGHVSSIKNTFEAIFNGWLPQSEYRIVQSPDFERYGDEFNPHDGNGTVEIWIPIALE